MTMLEAPIERVLVGRGYAEITRAVSLTSGDDGWPRSVSIGRLALTLDEASVRVRVEGEGVGAKSARVAMQAAKGALEPETDERAVRDAELACEKIRARCEALDRDARALAAIDVPSRPSARKGEAPIASPTDARLELAALVRERTERLGARLIAERRAFVRAEAEATATRAALAKASTERPARPDELEKVLVIELEGDAVDADARRPGPASVRVVVTYVVTGARWMPAYALRFARGAAALEVRALVQQETGEDWRGVKLALSSASMRRRADLPELTSLRIGRAQRGAGRRGYRAPPTGADALYADYDRALAALRAESSVTDEGGWLPQSLVDEDDVIPTGVDGPASLTRAGGPPAPSAAPMVQRAPGAMPQGYGAPQDARAEMKKESAAMLEVPRSRPPVGAPAASKPMRRRAGSETLAGLGGGGGGGATIVAELAQVDFAAAAASFASLRMGGVHGLRGELAAVGEAELLIEAAAAVHVSMHVRALGALASARARADAVEHASAPARYHAPDAFEGFDFVFETDAVVDVPSDGEGHAIAVTHAEAAAEVAHVVVPRESRDAFRVARFDSPLDAPLLAGPLDVYEDGEFLLSGELATTAPRGRVTVGLGVDAAVKVARNARFSEATTGLIRGTLELRHAVVVDVSNQRAETIHLEARERLPTTREKEEDIEVAITRVAPPWESFEPDPLATTYDPTRLRGGHRWRVDIPPAGSAKLELDYVVRIPSKNELVGGNRREP